MPLLSALLNTASTALASLAPIKSLRSSSDSARMVSGTGEAMPPCCTPTSTMSLIYVGSARSALQLITISTIAVSSARTCFLKSLRILLSWLRSIISLARLRRRTISWVSVSPSCSRKAAVRSSNFRRLISRSCRPLSVTVTCTRRRSVFECSRSTQPLPSRARRMLAMRALETQARSASSLGVSEPPASMRARMTAISPLIAWSTKRETCWCMLPNSVKS